MRLENRPYDTLAPGDSASLRRLITADDLYSFAAVSGNHNPMHLPDEDGDGDGHPEGVAPGMFIAAMISAVLGTTLPGPGTLYRHQTLNFHERAEAGDEVDCTVTVESKGEDRSVTLHVAVTRPADGAQIISGTAVVIAPDRPYTSNDIEVPGLIVQRHRHFDALLDLARPLPALVTAVVAPEEEKSLMGALLAMRESLIVPILIGDPAKIRTAAGDASLEGVEIIDEPDHARAAARAVALVNEGRAQALMKGHLHTDDLLRPIVARDGGLRVGPRRLTHVFVMDVPGMPHPLMVTDAAINIAPDLKTKVDIVQNAIDLAISLGHDKPRVGVLSAVETVNPDIQSSIDAALLSKMAERGQITGGYVDGPLAMDNAVDMGAARTKGLKGNVAGHANVLVVPGIDAGNMLAKQLAFISHAEGAGLVLGAKVPVILNSRSDSSKSRLASCAVAALHHARMTGQQKGDAA